MPMSTVTKIAMDLIHLRKHMKEATVRSPPPDYQDMKCPTGPVCEHNRKHGYKHQVNLQEFLHGSS
jgi:hypothetical protein